MADLVAAAQQLYSLTPDKFTAARNARAKEASAAGHKDLAAGIRSLPKPSAAAWTVNMLARDRPDEIDGVLALGARLRKAQSDLNNKALRNLSQQRRELVAALGTQAVTLARHLGQGISPATVDNVEQTLQAAMVDPRAAAALRTGRLTRALESIGFEPVDLADAVGAPEDSLLDTAQDVKERPSAGVSKRKLEDARHTAEEAARLAEGAAAELADIERRATEAARLREDLMDELDELKSQLAAIKGEVADADSEKSRLGRERDRATRAVEDATIKADQAREALERLT